MKTSEILDKLSPLFVDAIPRAVQTLKLKKPIACVRLYYFDTTAPCAYVALRIVSEKLRAKLLKDEGQNALFYLWASSEEKYDHEVIVPAEPPKSKMDQALTALLAQIYEQLMDRGLASYRKMLQNVARELNGKDWSKICPVTDDFVVAAADGSQAFADDYPDLVKSISPDRLKLLRKRGLLGAGEDWETRPGFEAASSGGIDWGKLIKEIDDKALALPVPRRIEFWIEQLEKTAVGKDCDMKRIEVSDGFAYDRLGDLGKDAVVPMLSLCERLFAKKNNADAWSIMVHGIFKVRDMSHATGEVETMLKQLLKKALRTDELTALHCAGALHALFKKKYPEPKQGDGKVMFTNAKEFLS